MEDNKDTSESINVNEVVDDQNKDTDGDENLIEEIIYEKEDSSAEPQTEEDEDIPKKKKKKLSKKHRIIIGIDIVLLTIWAIVLGVVFGGRGIVNSMFLNKINKEDKSSISIVENVTTTIDEDESFEPKDNIDDVSKNLIDTDAKTFFETGELADANYVKNILLIGTDVRVSDSWNGNSDSMILVSINEKTKKIYLTSFMRDLYVYIPVVDRCDKLNFAHASGGSNLLCQTISGNFKIKIDQYMRVDFYGLINIINAVGGIDMEVTDEEVPVANFYIKGMSKYTGDNPEDFYLTQGGNLHLNGIQAVAYARIRYVGNADYERTNRQRKILNAVFNKCKGLGVTEIKSFADKALPNLYTNMDNGEMWDIIENALSYLNYEIISQRVPFDDTSTGQVINGQSMIVPDLKTNVQKLLDTIYGE